MTPTHPIRASRLRLGVACMATLAIALIACTSASPSASVSSSTGAVSASPSDAPAEGHIAVVLQDVVIKLNSHSAPAGEVTFDAKNVGQPYEGIHEFIVFRTDLDAADLPTHFDESFLPTVIEDGLDIVGRTSHLRGGESASLTLTLEAGHYVLICNLRGHYFAMRENFSVH